MPERFTICNMTTEMGAKCGMVAPDPKTIDYLAPIAKHAMHPLYPDADARYERSHRHRRRWDAPDGRVPVLPGQRSAASRTSSRST